VRCRIDFGGGSSHSCVGNFRRRCADWRRRALVGDVFGSREFLKEVRRGTDMRLITAVLALCVWRTGSRYPRYHRSRIRRRETRNIDDVIFDHDTMEIRFLAVDSGWFASRNFPAPRRPCFRRRKPRGRSGHQKPLRSRLKILRDIRRNRCDQKTNGRNTSRSSRSIGRGPCDAYEGL